MFKTGNIQGQGFEALEYNIWLFESFYFIIFYY